VRFFVFPDAARAPKHRTANARRPRPIRGDGACLKVFGGPAGGRVHRRGCLARTYAPVGMSRADICAHGDVSWEICTGGDILREICTSGDARHSLGGYAGHLVTTHTNPGRTPQVSADMLGTWHHVHKSGRADNAIRATVPVGLAVRWVQEGVRRSAARLAPGSGESGCVQLCSRKFPRVIALIFIQIRGIIGIRQGKCGWRSMYNTVNRHRYKGTRAWVSRKGGY
jgi:hypothetical protein